jgi:LacI family sucrose operon transcriptional repressor
MTPKTSLKSLAALAGVSTSTASAVFNGKAEGLRIAPATIARVLEIAAREGYRACPLARSLRTGRSETIGLIVPHISNPFFAELIQGVEEVARSQGFQILIFDSSEDAEIEYEGIQNLLARNVDGLIIASIISPERWLQIRPPGIPLVFVDREIPGLQASSVATDAFVAAREACSQLLQKASELVYLGRRPDNSSNRHRFDGYLAALNMAGLPRRDELILQGDDNQEAGERMLRSWLEQHRRAPGALFCSSLGHLRGGLKALKAVLGELPKDMAIGTFDNDANLDFYVLPILSIQQDCLGLGAQAMELLIKSRAQASASCDLLLPARLIAR